MDVRKLTEFELSRGAHDRPDEGLCAMEAVALLEGLDHSAHPECTCPVIGAFVRRANDRMPDDRRAILVPLLPRLAGTVASGREADRADWAAWRAATGPTADALAAIGADREADRLRGVLPGDWMAARRAAQDARAIAAGSDNSLVTRACAWAGEAAAWSFVGSSIWASEAAASAAVSAARAMDTGEGWSGMLEILEGMLAIVGDNIDQPQPASLNGPVTPVIRLQHAAG